MAAGRDAIAAHEAALVARLLDCLAAKAAVRVIGPGTVDAAKRVAIVSFTACGIGIRHGHFYSPWLIDSLGLAATGGVVRVSMAHYNSLAEMNRLIEALDPLLDSRRTGAGTARSWRLMISHKIQPACKGTNRPHSPPFKLIMSHIYC